MQSDEEKPPVLKKRRNPRPLPHKVRYPDLDIPQILAWANAYFRRTERWPIKESGAVTEQPTTTWCGINIALQRGHRGLQGGSSLAQLLQE